MSSLPERLETWFRDAAPSVRFTALAEAAADAPAADGNLALVRFDLGDAAPFVTASSELVAVVDVQPGAAGG